MAEPSGVHSSCPRCAVLERRIAELEARLRQLEEMLLEATRSSIAARTEFYRMFAARIVLPTQEEARQVEKERREHKQDRTRRMFGDRAANTDADTADLIDRLLGDRNEHSDDSAKPGRPPAG